MYNLGGDLMRQQASLKPKVILKHNIALNQKMSQQLRILSFNNNELESFIEQFARDNIFTKIKYKTDNKDDLSWVKDDSNETLIDHLLFQVNTADFRKSQKQLIKFQILRLDENGYLNEADIQLANQSNESIEAIRKARDELIHLDPLGIGTESLSQRLLVQAKDRLEFNSVARSILENDQLEILAQPQKWKTLKWREDEIREALEAIRTLNPTPERDYGNMTSIQYIIPDLIFNITDNKIELKSSELNMPILEFDTEQFQNIQEKDIDNTSASFLKKQRKNYDDFCQALEKRHNTMSQIGKIICKYQASYLLSLDESKLEQLTMSQAAKELHLSVSTISRAIKGKYFQCQGKILPLKKLFTRNLINGWSKNIILRLIDNIIKNESRNKPISDLKIQRKLSDLNVKISRRTVNKYRRELNIKNSYNRIFSEK